MKGFLIAASVLCALCVPTGTASAHYYAISPYVEPAAQTDWRWQRLHNRAHAHWLKRQKPAARWFLAQKPAARWYVTRPHPRPHAHSWTWRFAGYW